MAVSYKKLFHIMIEKGSQLNHSKSALYCFSEARNQNTPDNRTPSFK